PPQQGDLAKTVAPGARKGGAPTANVPAPAPLPSFAEVPTNSDVVSLMEDDDEDENIATVIAPQRSLVPEHLRQPLPAAGVPSTPQVAIPPSITPVQAAYPPPSGQQVQAAAYPPPPYNPPQPSIPMIAPMPTPSVGGPPMYVPPPPAAPAVETTAMHKARRGPSPVLIGLVAVISLGIIGVVGFAVFGRDSGGPTAAAGSSTAVKTSSPVSTVVATVSSVPTTLPVAPATSSPPTVSLNDLTDPKKPTPTATSTSTAAPTATTTSTADKPDKPAGGDGKLSVVCVPACDSVSAGSRSLGPSPVVTTLPAGNYTLSLRRKGSATKSVGVTITAGQTSPVRVSME
ncbi:MAG: PEGA domain-containing protein, partial [Polyangiaceae bacterium]